MASKSANGTTERDSDDGKVTSQSDKSEEYDDENDDLRSSELTQVTHQADVSISNRDRMQTNPFRLECIAQNPLSLSRGVTAKSDESKNVTVGLGGLDMLQEKTM